MKSLSKLLWVSTLVVFAAACGGGGGGGGGGSSITASAGGVTQSGANASGGQNQNPPIVQPVLQSLAMHSDTEPDNWEQLLTGLSDETSASPLVQNYGAWNDPEYPYVSFGLSVHGSRTFGMVYGDLSPAPPNPAEGTSVTYRGVAYRYNIGPRTSEGGWADVTLYGFNYGDKNNASPLVEVSLTFQRFGRNLIVTWDDVPVTGNGFNAADTSADTTYTLRGNFFGPNHESVGGVFHEVSFGNPSAEGAFGAKR